jgi:hypothetical protein
MPSFEVIERFRFGRQGNPHVLGEQAVVVVAEPFRDIRGRRTQTVPQLIAEFVVVPRGRLGR